MKCQRCGKPIIGKTKLAKYCGSQYSNKGCAYEVSKERASAYMKAHPRYEKVTIKRKIAGYHRQGNSWYYTALLQERLKHGDSEKEAHKFASYAMRRQKQKGIDFTPDEKNYLTKIYE